MTIADRGAAELVNPVLSERGVRSLLGVRLVVEGRVIGVLHVGMRRARRFSGVDRDLLQLAADRAALAIDHARLFEQRRVVEAMQRALVPDPAPVVPGLEMAGGYRPAAVGIGIGGDWYDVLALDAGAVALVIGDVEGHGLEAAAAMAQIRRRGLAARASPRPDPRRAPR